MTYPHGHGRLLDLRHMSHRTGIPEGARGHQPTVADGHHFYVKRGQALQGLGPYIRQRESRGVAKNLGRGARQVIFGLQRVVRTRSHLGRRRRSIGERGLELE